LALAPNAEPAAAAADLPALLEVAYEHLREASAGQSEIWICSDLRANDWHAESPRWRAAREAFLALAAAPRFRLLAYAHAAPGNVSVRVTGARKRQAREGAELLLSLRLEREAGAAESVKIPLELEIESARSVMNIEMDGAEYELRDHAVPLLGESARGWGRVAIPSDANPADNEFYFAFEEPHPRRAIVVADDPLAELPLALAAEIPAEPAWPARAEVVPLAELAAIDWSDVALLLWQSRLPEGKNADAVRAFLRRGGSAVFFPPREPEADGPEFLGVRWTAWQEPPAPCPVESWRTDYGLLADAMSGAALPVGTLEILRYCALAGETAPLASLAGGALLLGSAAREEVRAYFCATTPAPADSSLGSGGVVLYALVQRALAGGAAALGNARMLDAGAQAERDAPLSWRRLAGPEGALSSEYAVHRGVYEERDALIAINRPAAEDARAVLAGARADLLFEGLNFARVEGHGGGAEALARETWKFFIAAMVCALLLEAMLSLPKVARARSIAA
ncbi:MAG: hypothetical protein L0Z55_13045, partial [Planctomycetes bacterium]|nr:hypothetical protein [Planctomycetota bacterium]